MERALENYIEELKSDVQSLVYSEGEGASFEDKFTEYCISVFESIGKSEGARVLSYIHPNSQGGVDWKINGYCLKDLYKDEDKKEYYETLDLFITNFKIENYQYNITKDDYLKSLNQIKRFINSSLKRHIDYIDPSHRELNELIKIIGKQGHQFDRVNVNILINGFSSHEKDKFTINDIDIFVNTWDISRLFKINESNSTHEPIEIEFEKFSDNGNGLQCLQVPNIDKMYDCFLAIVPGEILAKLYKEFSNELLESNVRAFLGQAGKFNKGIRETIRNKPQMFLPYNNGITATAESVLTKVVDNQLIITKLNDFQIVNGGQTTASLYHTKKKFKDTDLSKIFVQMKLTVIKDKEKKNIEVPNISRYANSQNKVSELDLSSNNPYFIQIENLSRKKYVVNPENKNHSQLWYFERANGQYRETLSKLTTVSNQRKFKEQNPSNLKFVKSDIAKYINLWEQEPHYVSQGSQKNFIHFMKKVNDDVSKNRLPGINLYTKLIANAVLFKTFDKLFGRKNIDAIGDTNLKSFTVAYSVSYFHFLTKNRLDLLNIYNEQTTDSFLNEHFKKIIVFVNNHLIENSRDGLISEYAKRDSSWKKLKETDYPLDLIYSLKNYLITENEKLNRDSEKEADVNLVEEAIFHISEIYEFGLRFWDGFYQYNSKKSLGFDYLSLMGLFSNLKNQRNLSKSDILIGRKAIDFIRQNPKLIDDIKSYSKVAEIETLKIKSIYDKLLIYKKEDWKQIIDFASQSKIFNNLELSNIKSLHVALFKKEIIKEQALIKCYESLQKLKKFGFKV
jgi:hypothetical protein